MVDQDFMPDEQQSCILLTRLPGRLHTIYGKSLGQDPNQSSRFILRLKSKQNRLILSYTNISIKPKLI